MKSEEKTIRENLVLFYNELSGAYFDAFKNYKKRPTEKVTKRICKPIVDKWEKIFNGHTKCYTLTMELPVTQINETKNNIWVRK